MSADSIVGDGLAQSPYERMKAQMDALRRGQDEMASESREMLDALRAERDAALSALRHQRDALIIIRDRQGGCASVEDINQGIAQIDAALREGKP